jgi:hypothetical protein
MSDPDNIDLSIDGEKPDIKAVPASSNLTGKLFPPLRL